MTGYEGAEEERADEPTVGGAEKATVDINTKKVEGKRGRVWVVRRGEKGLEARKRGRKT